MCTSVRIEIEYYLYSFTHLYMNDFVFCYIIKIIILNILHLDIHKIIVHNFILTVRNHTEVTSTTLMTVKVIEVVKEVYTMPKKRKTLVKKTFNPTIMVSRLAFY